MINFSMLLIGGVCLLIGFIPFFHVHRHQKIPGDPVRGDLPRLTAVSAALGFFCLTVAVTPWYEALARVFHGKAGTAVLGLIWVACALLFRYQALRRHKPRPARRWWQRKKKDPNGNDVPDTELPQEIYYHRVFAMSVSILLGVTSMAAYGRADALLYDAKTSPSTTVDSANAAAAAVRSGKAAHSISAGGAMFALATLVALIAAIIIAIVIHHRHVTGAKAARQAKRDAGKNGRRGGGQQQAAGRGQAPQQGLYGGQGAYGPQGAFGAPGGAQPVYGPQGAPGGAVPPGRNPRAIPSGGKRS